MHYTYYLGDRSHASLCVAEKQQAEWSTGLPPQLTCMLGASASVMSQLIQYGITHGVMMPLSLDDCSNDQTVAELLHYGAGTLRL